MNYKQDLYYTNHKYVGGKEVLEYNATIVAEGFPESELSERLIMIEKLIDYLTVEKIKLSRSL